MSTQEKVVVLDFGSQYNQLIVRKVREAGVYCEIHPFHISAEQLRQLEPTGLIFSGGPASVLAEDSPVPDPAVFELGVPILGICYGLQVISHLRGGRVQPSSEREYGHAEVHATEACPLLAGLPEQFQVWMSHGDKVVQLPTGFRTVGASAASEHAVIANGDGTMYGVQFHPEVVHTPQGTQMLENFARKVCGCTQRWTMGEFISESIERIRGQATGTGQVICGVSGGVDSTVAAALVGKAIGDRLTCIFVDNGVLRHDEVRQVQTALAEGQGIDLRVVDASERFLQALAGVTDPELKRKRIGNLFIDVFQEEAERIGQVDYLVQGTLYPDVIESVSTHGPSATIKSHHNVGGLPETMHLQLIEPLRELFKDEVRAVGRQLGLPAELIGRHPFPGPGLAVRIIGEVTRERCDLLRAADRIFIEELHRHGVYDEVWQAFTVLLPVHTVGVMGDERTYGRVVVVRAVTSTDGMTADWARLPESLLRTVSGRIIGEVDGINRVVYDVTSKPPGTIEWE